MNFRLLYSCVALLSCVTGVRGDVPAPPLSSVAVEPWRIQALDRYRPVTDAMLAENRQAVDERLAQVRERLAKMPNGATLANEMHLGDLVAQLASPQPDLNKLELIYVSMSRSFPAAVQSSIDRLRSAVRRHADWVTVRNLPQAKDEFAKQVNRLADEMKRLYAAKKVDSLEMRSTYAWLSRTHRLDDLLEQVQTEFSYPNQMLVVRREYFDQLAEKPVTQPVNVNESTGGVSVRGSGSITAQPAVKLIPNPAQGEVKLEIVGNGNVPLVARKKPATLNAVNRMYFTADQTLLVTPQGVDHREPVICVRSNTSLQCVNLDFRSRLLKRIATPIVAKIAGKQLAKGDPQIAAKAKEQITKTLREEAFTLIDHVNVLINRIFWQTIDARDVNPNIVVSTSPERLAWIGEYRSDWQLGAPSEPPAYEGVQPQIAVQMHESSVNNVSAVAAGKRMNEVVFNEMIFDNIKLVPVHPEPLPLGRMPAAFTFADRDPLEMHIEQKQLKVRFRIKSFEYDSRVYEGPERIVRVVYQPRVGQEGVEVVRQGDIQYEPAMGPNDKELRACFERFFVPKAVQLRNPASPSGSSSPVKLTHLTFDDGWLLVGFMHPVAP